MEYTLLTLVGLFASLMVIAGITGFKRESKIGAPHYAANEIGGASFTIVTTNVAVQLTDVNFQAIAKIGAVEVYLSDSADGHTLTATAPDTVAIGTNGVIVGTMTTVKCFKVISNTSGQFDLTIAKSGGHSYYLVVCLPDGTIIVSSVIVAA